MIDSKIVKDFLTLENITSSIDGFYSRDCENVLSLQKDFENYGQYIKSNLSYDKYGSVFNSAYYRKNLLKNLYLFNEIKDFFSKSNFSFRDIGCGTAPSSAALSLVVRREFKKKIRVELYDKSFSQLSLAERVLSAMKVPIVSSNNTNYDFSMDCPYNGTSLFSYFLCEQGNDMPELLYQSRGMLKGGFIVLDYESTVARIQKHFEERGDTGISVINKTFTLPNLLVPYLNTEEVSIHGCYYSNEEKNR